MCLPLESPAAFVQQVAQLARTELVQEFGMDGEAVQDGVLPAPQIASTRDRGSLS